MFTYAFSVYTKQL